MTWELFAALFFSWWRRSLDSRSRQTWQKGKREEIFEWFMSRYAIEWNCQLSTALQYFSRFSFTRHVRKERERKHWKLFPINWIAQHQSKLTAQLDPLLCSHSFCSALSSANEFFIFICWWWIMRSLRTLDVKTAHLDLVRALAGDWNELQWAAAAANESEFDFHFQSWPSTASQLRNIFNLLITLKLSCKNNSAAAGERERER